MSKMKELSAVLDELVTCGETLISTANSLKEISSDTAADPAPAPKNKKPPASKKADKSAPAEAKAEEPKQETPAPKEITKEQVRGILAAKSSAGYSDEVRALLAKYGAKQLKQVDPKDYADLIKDAEAIDDLPTEVLDDE